MNTIQLKKPLHILLDMDNTIADLDRQVLTFLKMRGLGFDHLNYNSYQIFNFFTGVSEEKKESILYEMFDDDLFWLTMKKIPYSKKVVKVLNKNYKLTIATKPFRDEKRFKETKKEWICDHYPYLSNNDIVFNFEKWNVSGNVIIDDNPEILTKCMEKGDKIVIKALNVYNKEIPSHFEFNNWLEIPFIFNTIENSTEWDKYLVQ